MKTILLFDMDGVLLTPRGYCRAFQETVALVGRALGYSEVRLTADDIAAFEAAGVSSEWDSAAICAALLLENLWEQFPVLTLPADLSAKEAHHVPLPEFRDFVSRLGDPRWQGLPPLARAERLLLDNAVSRTGLQRRALTGILHNARHIHGSLTHRVFQELVLGSEVFKETYGLSPFLDAESYLLQHDQPALPESMRASLLDWLQHPNHRAAIFTGRPSRPWSSHFGTPEAEIGAQLVGLEGLPVVGFGELSWVSLQRGLDPQRLLKPSPVHVLAAFALALGVERGRALDSAVALALDGREAPHWQQLKEAQVHVFEDTVAGLQSANKAQEILDEINIPITFYLCGVTRDAQKRQSLEAVGARVFPDLAMALSAQVF